MRILAVAPQPFFTPRGTPFSVYYRSVVTAELGHQVDILAYGQGLDVAIPNTRLIRIPAFRFLGRVKTGPSLLKLFLDIFMIAWTVGLLVRRRYDVVHAHEEAVFWCRWLKPVFRFKLVYDMHSSLPQQLDNFDFTSSRAIHWIFDQLEADAVRSADAVIAICPALEEYARGLRPDDSRLLLIENSVFDPVRFAVRNSRPSSPDDPPASADPELEAWLARRPEGHTVVYAGTLEAYQGIDLLLEAFVAVSRSDAAARLLIVGGLPADVARYRGMAAGLGIGARVYFTGQLPQAEAQELVARCAISVSPRLSGNNTPLKIYQLMASGVPLVATRIESHTQVLTDDTATLTGATAEELADGIVEALGSPEAAGRRAEFARRRYQDKYSREVYVRKMQRLFELVG